MIKLETTQAQFESLHELVQGQAKSVRVDVKALTNLLIDHAVMVRTARSKGIKVEEPSTGARAKVGLS